jgi:hypothetical protein
MIPQRRHHAKRSWACGIYIPSMSFPCGSCPFFHTPSCTCSCPSECDLAAVLAGGRNSPLCIKFSYLDEWRHIPAEERYEVAEDHDFERAVRVFRERHGSQGTLMVFATENMVEWWVWGYVPVGETCKG